jgi:ketol-acid reductoisomerase
MTVIYRDEHGDLNVLNGKRVCLIGYGSLGRPLALNLRDSGVNLVIGVRAEPSKELAQSDGMTAVSVVEAVKNADVIILMLPDEVMPQVYLEQISPHLRRGQTLIFSSAYNITYRFIEPPPFVDVGLIAPRAIGPAIRETIESGEGYCSFVSVAQDSSGQAWKVVLALAKAMGALQAGAIEISFEQESELDLFMQQAVLPALHHILTTAAQLLLNKGYPPEAAFTELYLSGEFSYLMQQVAAHGLLNTLRRLPLKSQYGAISRLDRFSDMKLERLMEVTLEEIHSTDFAREWAKDYADGQRRLQTFYKNQRGLELWELEQQTLELLGRETDEDT